MNERDIFNEAIQRENPSERNAYLDGACGTDVALRARIERLLAAHEKNSGFGAGHDEFTATIGIGITEGPGSQIGPYKLLQLLGEGGFGVVYLAEQSEPVKRKVALKIIKPGMDSKAVIARFEAERQALALMDHPHIARVLDGGMTATGRPYFVMELVKGIPITKFCDQEKLGLRERMELFVPVCQAVQHAHQKGIIHRDLKPSNVLIALYDGKPVVKVIDFGVAKATGASLTDATLHTQVGQMIGTLEYMAPEQAELNNLDIDTRADIYSLGVILYELMTGAPPFSGKELMKAGYAQMLKMIREQEPQKPSTRLSRSDELPSIAAARKLEPTRLARLLHNEPDWIVMKCLEKERARRYETANALAADIGRYLNNEPVTAGPVSRVYRVRTFLRRNKGPALAAAVIALLLVCGIVGTTWGLVRAEKARREAVASAGAERLARESEAAQRVIAEAAAESERKAKEFAEARGAETKAVLEFVENQVFAAARPEGQEGGLGRDVTLRSAIESALPRIKSSFRDQPLIEAALSMTIGQSFWYLGDAKRAEAQFLRARELYTATLGSDHPDTLASINNLAGCYQNLGRYEEAVKLHEESLALMKTKLGLDHPHTLGNMDNLALSYAALGRHGEALKLQEETLMLWKAKSGRDHPDTLKSMNNLALSYTAMGRHAEALKLHEETLVLQKTNLGPDHPDTLIGMGNIANSYLQLGRYDEALKLSELTLERMKAKLGPDHPYTLLSMVNLASSYMTLGRHTESLKLHEETLGLLKTRNGPQHPTALACMNNLAISYAALGRHAEALELREESLRIQKATLDPDHPETLRTMTNLANSYAELGRYEEALKLREETLRLQQSKFGPDHPATLSSMNNLAISYAELGHHVEALKLFDESLQLRKNKLGPDHPDTLLTMGNVAASLVALDRDGEARTMIDECLQRATGKDVDPSLVPTVMYIQLGILREKIDVVGCMEIASRWEALKRSNAGDLYWSACFRGVCSVVIQESTIPDSARHAREQADLAMVWLRKAVDAGWNTPEQLAHMMQDPDLAALCDREDFKKLLAEIEARSALRQGSGQAGQEAGSP